MPIEQAIFRKSESPKAGDPGAFATQHEKDSSNMHDSTTREFFKLIKGCVEQHLDRNGWRWSLPDSLLLDWCVLNLEDTHGR